jgi:hypothetical protein
MVWAGITVNSRTNLHLFNKNVTGQIYRHYSGVRS